MRPAHDSMTPTERQILADVEENGLHVVHVEEADEQPGHSYSVGLWESFGQPEVLVVGLDPAVAADLLEAIADANDGGETFAPGTRHAGLLQGYQVRFLPLPPAAVAEHLGVAVWAHDGAPFQAVQLVYPDKQGRWPWDPAAREAFRDNQPVYGAREPQA